MAPTVLIGLDGATFTVLDSLMAAGVMPFLSEFCRQGARGDLLSTPHPLTPPAWTSLMTGRTPGNHGIYDFVRVEERGDDVYFTLNNSRDIQCETIWSLLSRQGRRVAALNFPLTAPPAPVVGCVVPGLVSWKHFRRNVYPADLYESLKALPSFSAREVAWDFDLERQSMKTIPSEDYEGWVRVHIRREKGWFEILRHVMARERHDLTAIVFDGADKLQHVCWRFLDPALLAEEPSEWEQRVRALCLEYFRQLDGFLAEIARLAGPEGRLFFVSDHGFGATRQVFRVNTWLHEQGYLAWKSTDAVDESTRQSLARRMNSDVALVDLDRTTAWGRTSASNGILIRVAKNGGPGVPRDQYLVFRSRLANQLLGVRDPETGEPILDRILTREEAFAGAQSAQAPDLTLVFRDGGFVSIVNKEPFLVPRPEVTGTHRREGIFIAGGPGIRSGVRLPALDMVDVPCALLYSLGLPIPEDFEGRVPAEAFEATLLAARPPVRGDLTQAPATADGAADDDEEGVASRLRALGYLE